MGDGTFMISSPPVDLVNYTVTCVVIFYAVDTLCKNDFGCYFVATKQDSHTHISAYIYENTTFPLPFEECALLLFYILYINIYKETFCKWTSIAYIC